MTCAESCRRRRAVLATSVSPCYLNSGGWCSQWLYCVRTGVPLRIKQETGAQVVGAGEAKGTVYVGTCTGGAGTCIVASVRRNTTRETPRLLRTAQNELQQLVESKRKNDQHRVVILPK